MRGGWIGSQRNWLVGYILQAPYFLNIYLQTTKKYRVINTLRTGEADLRF